ncbi:hypothetical protein BDV95DRAFT_257605 [Massariosphaeria phaeospora]|uniref:Uncharacterized protein n=1 Tax=Massariosphaeria phaeospora TaxID=100035 RepID=A0A7C8M265_9PLEO|nr:hypothetical protein BDV95DRAFT_257605 [Massariosphaeria phaeospora]
MGWCASPALPFGAPFTDIEGMHVQPLHSVLSFYVPNLASWRSLQEKDRSARIPLALGLNISSKLIFDMYLVQVLPTEAIQHYAAFDKPEEHLDSWRQETGLDIKKAFPRDNNLFGGFHAADTA